MLNKEKFDMIKDYADKVNELYFKLVDLLGDDKAAELVNDFEVLEYKYMGISEDEDLSKFFDEDKLTYITDDYEGAVKYLKLYVIRECEDNMFLCISTAEFYHLVPRELLADIDKIIL